MRYKFWIKNGLRNALLHLIAPFGFTSIHLIGKYARLTQSDYLEILAIGSLIVGSLAMLFMGAYVLQEVAPLALRFSRTRREILLGIQVSRGITFLPLLVVTAVLVWASSFGQGADFWKILLLLTGQYLLVSGLGGLFGTTYPRRYGGLWFALQCVCYSVLLFLFEHSWYDWGGADNGALTILFLVLGVLACVWCYRTEQKRLAWMWV